MVAAVLWLGPPSTLAQDTPSSVGGHWDPCALSGRPEAACLDSAGNDAWTASETEIFPTEAPETQTLPGYWGLQGYRPLQSAEEDWDKTWRYRLQTDAGSLATDSRWQNGALLMRHLHWSSPLGEWNMGDLPLAKASPGVDFIQGRGQAVGWSQASNRDDTQDAWLFSAKNGINGLQWTTLSPLGPISLLAGWNRLRPPESRDAAPVDAGVWGVAGAWPAGNRPWKYQALFFRAEQGENLRGESAAFGLQRQASLWHLQWGLGWVVHRNLRRDIQTDGYAEVSFGEIKRRSFSQQMRLRQAGKHWYWPYTQAPLSVSPIASGDTGFPAAARGQGDWRWTSACPFSWGWDQDIQAENGILAAWDSQGNLRSFQSEHALAWRKNHYRLINRFWNRWQWKSSSTRRAWKQRWRGEAEWVHPIWKIGFWSQVNFDHAPETAFEENANGNIEASPWEIHLTHPFSRLPRAQFQFALGGDFREWDPWVAKASFRGLGPKGNALGLSSWIKAKDLSDPRADHWWIGLQLDLNAASGGPNG